MYVDLSKIKEELRDLIRESVREELQAHQPPSDHDPEELLTIEQVVKMLHISKPTLHAWKKQGILPFERMGRRVYFKRGAVMAAMKSINLKNS